MTDHIAELTTICPGWSELPDSIMSSSDIAGGIIDRNAPTGEWFIIFNDDRAPIEGLPSRGAAVQRFIAEHHRPTLTALLLDAGASDTALRAARAAGLVRLHGWPHGNWQLTSRATELMTAR